MAEYQNCPTATIGILPSRFWTTPAERKSKCQFRLYNGSVWQHIRIAGKFLL